VAHDARLSALNNIDAWSINLLLVLLAVRLTGVPVRDYLGWTRPRTPDVAIGILIIVALCAALGFLLLRIGEATPAVNENRTAIAGGTSPWWFVLRWWPAIFLAPFVEESFFPRLPLARRASSFRQYIRFRGDDLAVCSDALQLLDA